MDKQNIAILFGGCSSEYEVSLQSAYAVIAHMNREKYHPVLLGITRRGEWFHFTSDLEKIRQDQWHNPAYCTRAVISPSRDTHGLLTFTEGAVIETRLAAAMPVLHGKNGEDGTVQGLLELAGIPIVGCQTLSSALCMDKDKAHKLASLAGVRIPRSFLIERSMNEEAAFAQAEALGYPLFVKPVRAGSSMGITKVSAPHEWAAACHRAFLLDDRIIVEENIPGFEVGCAVLGNDRLLVGEVDEIELASGFFDYHEKYLLETAVIHVPARISPQKAEEIKEAAKLIYRALDCAGFARVDMFLTPSGEIVFNEVNTIPGFTSHSRYPNMLKASGLTFEQIIDTAIEQALCGSASTETASVAGL